MNEMDKEDITYTYQFTTSAKSIEGRAIDIFVQLRAKISEECTIYEQFKCITNMWIALLKMDYNCD